MAGSAVTVHHYFDNGDALLCLLLDDGKMPTGTTRTKSQRGRAVGIRMLLTNSGHHLIPHGDERSYDKEALNILRATRGG